MGTSPVLEDTFYKTTHQKKPSANLEPSSMDADTLSSLWAIPKRAVGFHQPRKVALLPAPTAAPELLYKASHGSKIV